MSLLGISVSQYRNLSHKTMGIYSSSTNKYFYPKSVLLLVQNVQQLLSPLQVIKRSHKSCERP